MEHAWHSHAQCMESCECTRCPFEGHCSICPVNSAYMRTNHAYLTVPRLLGEYSKWSGYLQSLPPHTAPIALLWGINEAWTNSDQGHGAVEDAQQAARLACGTEIERELLGDECGYVVVRLPSTSPSTCPAVPHRYDRGNSFRSRAPYYQFLCSVSIRAGGRQSLYLILVSCVYHTAGHVLTYLSPVFQDEIRQYYSTVVIPALSSPHFTSRCPLPPAISFSGFLHAYSLISSRSFLVDAYHSLAMVPIADA